MKKMMLGLMAIVITANIAKAGKQPINIKGKQASCTHCPKGKVCAKTVCTKKDCCK